MGEQFSKQIKINLSNEQHAQLITDMQRCNYGKVTAYARDKIFEPQKLDTELVPVLKDLRRAYAQINNNINQIAKYLNTFKYKMTDDDFETLKEELCSIDEYVRDVHSMLSDRFDEYETPAGNG